MLLQNIKHYNDLSPELREKLEAKVKGFGKTVRYRFEIAKPNPDPTKYNGDTIWPMIYTLDPAVFQIRDTNEKRKDHNQSKTIALIDRIDDNGKPDRFRKIKVEAKDRGILTLHIEDIPEHFDYAMCMEMHPKNANGLFSDKTKQQIFSRIDENALATEQRKERSARKLAMDTAEKMSDAEIQEFADAMQWNFEILTLRNMTEDMAEKNPIMFNDLVEGKKIKYQAAIKRAVDKNLVSYDPADCRLSWTATGQAIVALGSTVDGKNDFERLAEWFMTAGDVADKAYKKLTAVEKQASATT
jgi:hypothetical protein